jgi:RNA polymerase sigma-70 factor (ECF subfamily)
VQRESINNERALLQELANGQEAAFRTLFHTYFDNLYGAAFAYTKVHEQAEDVVQQVFLTLWEKRQTLLSVENLENYLFIIARNLILGQFRKQLTHEKHITYLRELFGAGESLPDEILISRQQRDLLEEAVRRLPPKQQEAYRLSREKGLSHEEIARVMNISKTTVKEHISNSLKSIKAFLDGYVLQLYPFILIWLLK